MTLHSHTGDSLDAGGWVSPSGCLSHTTLCPLGFAPLPLGVGGFCSEMDKVAPCFASDPEARAALVSSPWRAECEWKFPWVSPSLRRLMVSHNRPHHCPKTPGSGDCFPGIVTPSQPLPESPDAPRRAPVLGTKSSSSPGPTEPRVARPGQPLPASHRCH